ncbi:MAG: hypothetical protein F9K17_13585 [Phycisphaerae bacterium]|nr:MAG: hypothetical protein F9K17_13585 [Phycisphaerae bacterium]
MVKKGPKIKELAQELGLTSRQLIDRCREAGIPVQNSASRLDRASAERLRTLVAGAALSDATNLSEDDEPS